MSRTVSEYLSSGPTFAEGEVIDRIEHEGAREVAREWLTARL